MNELRASYNYMVTNSGLGYLLVLKQDWIVTNWFWFVFYEVGLNPFSEKEVHLEMAISRARIICIGITFTSYNNKKLEHEIIQSLL